MTHIAITTHILKFRDFLLSGWQDVHNLIAGHSYEKDSNFIDDWMQANWEFLVERELLQRNGFINSIGLYEPQPRISNPDAQCTHLVMCKSKTAAGLIDVNKKIRIPSESLLKLRCFYARSEKSYILSPPFDYVGASFIGNEELFCFELNNVEFYLCGIEELLPPEARVHNNEI